MSLDSRVATADAPSGQARDCAPDAGLRRFPRSYGLVAVSGAMRARDPLTGVSARGAATRERILSKAEELVERRGIDAITVDGVCQASDTSKSQFYQHFCEKDDLVRSVLTERARVLLSQQRRELQAVKTLAGLGDWRDRLVAANGQRGSALGCVLATMVSELADCDESSRLMLAGYFAEWQRLTAAALRRLQTAGELRRDADAEHLATGLMAALQGGYVLAQASRDIDDMAAAIDMALHRIRSFAGPR